MGRDEKQRRPLSALKLLSFERGEHDVVFVLLFFLLTFPNQFLCFFRHCIVTIKGYIKSS